MSVIRVETGKPYDVRIDAGLIGRADDWFAPFARNGRAIVVADAKVAALHLDALKRGLAGLRVETVLIPA